MRLRGFHFGTGVALLIFACLTIGCARAVVTARQADHRDAQLSKPGRIIVCEFAATLQDLPADDPLRKYIEQPARPHTEEEISIGKKLGAEIAGQIVEKILALGLPAARASSELTPRTGDIVIRGAIVSIDEGSRLKRVLLGFGAGAGELKTLVEINQITPTEPRPLISEEIEAKGGKMPGMLFTMGIAVAAGPAGLAIAPAAASGPAGIIGQSAATSGSVNVAKELGPESIQAATKRTVKKIIEELTQIFKRHGWI